MSELYSREWVAAETALCAEVWHACELQPGGLNASYSRRDHEAREIAFDASLQEVEWEARRLQVRAADRKAAEGRMIASFARFAQQALDLEEEAISLLTDDFLPAGVEFARRARVFDPKLSRADTIQACRNAWTACGLQPLLGVPSAITPSILGYSLLYPYSDNYLDSEKVKSEAKLAFSGRFRERLRGRGAAPSNRRESAVWALVGLIEKQYPRARFPEVFHCLLAIHQAQENSMAQQRRGVALDDEELLRLSLAKGGTSVLADACLARGGMNEEESRVAFEWGALLQLGDDLQDVRSDFKDGSLTLFTCAVQRGEPLDRLVLALLAFCESVSVRMARLPNGTDCLKNLLRMSWSSLVIAAVADGHAFFSPAFVAQAERCSPFRFAFLRARKAKLASRDGLYAHLFDLFAEQPAEGAAEAQSWGCFQERGLEVTI